MKNLKKLPEFKKETEEKAFLEKQHSTQYFDCPKAKPVVFPNLKSSTKTISLRLPESLLNAIKTLANKEDVLCQSLIKILFPESIKEAYKHKN